MRFLQMRVLLDENLPVDLATLLEGDHQVATVAGLRWQGVSNGELLARIEGKFDVLVTMDRGIPYQQALGGRAISVLGLRARSNRPQIYEASCLRSSPRLKASNAAAFERSVPDHRLLLHGNLRGPERSPGSSRSGWVSRAVQ